MWMDQFDQCNNNLDIHNTIYLMRSGLTKKLSEDDYVCTRGLERYDSGREERKAIRKQSICIALAMQRLLRRSGCSSPEMIASAYQKYTIKSRYIAHRKGIQDREEVEADIASRAGKESA